MPTIPRFANPHHLALDFQLTSRSALLCEQEDFRAFHAEREQELSWLKLEPSLKEALAFDRNVEKSPKWPTKSREPTLRKLDADDSEGNSVHGEL